MTSAYPDSHTDCPCQSGYSFGQCCQTILDNTSIQVAKTAEQLMRSRYCAYTIKDSEYLLKTWHLKYRPASLDLNTEDERSQQQWIGLKIKKIIQGGQHDKSGQVHFIARYKINGKAYKLEENSFFEKMNGTWFYLNGIIKR
jgi:SEC-C motif-containing protein